MIKTFLTGALAIGLAVQPAMAQHSKVTTAWGYLNNKDYEKARDAINVAITNDATKGEPKTWWYRGEAYQGIYSTTKSKLEEAADKKPASDPAYKAYIDYLANSTDLNEANISYRKAIELSPKFTDANSDLVNVALFTFNDGLTLYNEKRYAPALDRLQQFELSYKALGKDQKRIDDAFKSTNPPTDIREVKLYMAGAAIQLDQRTLAKSLFQELVASNFPNQAVYVNLYRYDLADKDTAAGLKVLDDGMKNLPENMRGGLLIEKLKYLVGKKQTKEAISVAEDAIKNDPKNISLYTALGKMYSEQKMYDKALEIFKKGQAVDSKNFGLQTGIGLVKYNQGVDKYNASVNTKNNAESDKLLADAKTIWKDATAELENALNLPRTSSDQEDLRLAYDALSNMYYKNGDPANGKKYRELYNKN